MPNRVTRSSPSCVANFPENESHFNDAYENNPYLQKVREKQEKNKQKLKELGLDDGFNLKRRIPTGKNRRELQFPAHKPPLTAEISNMSDGTIPAKRNLRRSSRQSKKPPMYTGIEEFNDASALAKKIAKRRNEISKKGRKVNRRVFDLGSQIDKKDRDQFTSVSSEEWIKDMTRFFREKEDNSITNVQRTMSVVRKLVSGHGVQHPATKEFFKKNEKVNDLYVYLFRCNVQCIFA